MRKLLSSILSIFMIPLVFCFGGAGTYIVSYCCDDCRTGGIMVVVEDKCCEIHGHDHHDHHHAHHHHPASSDCVEFNLDDEPCCGVERVGEDWDYFFVTVDDLKPVLIDLMAIDSHEISLPTSDVVSDIDVVMPTGPPPLLPRTYLSLLTTLLI